MYVSGYVDVCYALTEVPTKRMMSKVATRDCFTEERTMSAEGGVRIATAQKDSRLHTKRDEVVRAALRKSYG